MHSDMALVEQLAALLQQNDPAVKLRVKGSAIQVLPVTADGFLVSFEDQAPDYTVYFGSPGWHNHFAGTGLQDALFWFALGLSSQARLKVISHGDKDYAWAVERKMDSAWVQVGYSMTVWTLFWKRKQVRYLANNGIQDPKRFVELIDVAAFIKEGQRLDQERRDSAANRSMARFAIVAAFVLGLIQLAEGATETGWQQVISLLIGTVTVVVGIGMWVRYRSHF